MKEAVHLRIKGPGIYLEGTYPVHKLTSIAAFAADCIQTFIADEKEATTPSGPVPSEAPQDDAQTASQATD